MRHDLEVINRTVEKTYDWIGRVSDGAGFSFEDPHRAYQALKAVLHALRDRLPLEVTSHLAAQLPMLVRGVFYEGWDPTKTPVRMSLAQFLARVESDAGLKGISEAEDAARAVISLLWEELGEGTMEHLMSVLPREYAALM